MVSLRCCKPPTTLEYNGRVPATGEQQHVLVGGFDQQVVQADLAELIDDDGSVGEVGLAQQVSQDCRLAAAEKAGQDRNRDHGGTSGETAMRTRLFCA